MSFKEKQEFEALEKEIPQLEAEKADIELQLSSGSLDNETIIKVSERYAKLTDLIDEKTMRWLELLRFNRKVSEIYNWKVSEVIYSQCFDVNIKYGNFLPFRGRGVLKTQLVATLDSNLLTLNLITKNQ